MTSRRVDRDPNRGNRRIPLSTVSAADLLGLNDDEPCVCDTDFTCMADEHDKGRCDACEAPGIYPLCCADHQARMCNSCTNANHGGEP